MQLFLLIYFKYRSIIDRQIKIMHVCTKLNKILKRHSILKNVLKIQLCICENKVTFDSERHMQVSNNFQISIIFKRLKLAQKNYLHRSSFSQTTCAPCFLMQLWILHINNRLKGYTSLMRKCPFNFLKIFGLHFNIFKRLFLHRMSEIDV